MGRRDPAVRGGCWCRWRLRCRAGGVFFFSDVEGSTRLLAELDDRFPPLLGEHQRLVRGALARHGGLEISTEGDSFFAVFRGAPDAVAAAADAQRGLTAFDWPRGFAFRVRIGLHVGQAMLAGDNCVGMDINRAARITNAANGGQVILSDEMARAVAADLPVGLGLRDLGRRRLKDIGAARLWQLEIDGLQARSSPLRTLEAHPSNLPAEVTSLVDREAELVELRRLIIDRSSGATGGSASSSSARGTALLRSDRHAEALTLLRTSLVVFHDLEDIDGVTESLERLGEAAMGTDARRAARLLLAAQSIREREHIGLRRTDERVVSELITRTGETLGADGLVVARADADAMDVDAAVAYALADGPPSQAAR